MKRITTYIQEKLIVNNTIQGYNYHPKTKQELIECIQKKINKEGYGTKNKPLNLNDIDTSEITNMSYLFDAHNGSFILSQLSSIGYFDIYYWDVSNVENMYAMFFNSFFDGDLSCWDVRNVKNIIWMFGKSNFTGNISDWNVSNAENMDYMFDGSRFNGDISNWNVSNVINMEGMFKDSEFTGENGDISKWNVSNVENMKKMFDNCPLEKNPPKWYK